MNKIFYLFAVLALFSLVGVGCALLEPPGAEVIEPPEPGAVEDSAGIANPASVYCVEDMGGELKMYENDLGVAGYCLLPDNRLCEEWKLFNSEGKECVGPGEDERPVE